MERTKEERPRRVRIGEPVYDSEGTQVGRVQRITPNGVVISGRNLPLASPFEATQHLDGTMHLMWRCNQCGEVGKLTGALPELCPNCQAQRQDLYYWTED